MHITSCTTHRQDHNRTDTPDLRIFSIKFAHSNRLITTEADTGRNPELTVSDDCKEYLKRGVSFLYFDATSAFLFLPPQRHASRLHRLRGVLPAACDSWCLRYTAYLSAASSGVAAPCPQLCTDSCGVAGTAAAARVCERVPRRMLSSASSVMTSTPRPWRHDVAPHR